MCIQRTSGALVLLMVAEPDRPRSPDELKALSTRTSKYVSSCWSHPLTVSKWSPALLTDSLVITTDGQARSSDSVCSMTSASCASCSGVGLDRCEILWDLTSSTDRRAVGHAPTGSDHWGPYDCCRRETQRRFRELFQRVSDESLTVLAFLIGRVVSRGRDRARHRLRWLALPSCGCARGNASAIRGLAVECNCFSVLMLTTGARLATGRNTGTCPFGVHRNRRFCTGDRVTTGARSSFFGALVRSDLPCCSATCARTRRNQRQRANDHTHELFGWVLGQ